MRPASTAICDIRGRGRDRTRGRVAALARWSYAGWRAAYLSRASGGARRRKCDRVILWRGRPEWVAAFFGCTLRGAVGLPWIWKLAGLRRARARADSARCCSSRETRAAARASPAHAALEELERPRRVTTPGLMNCQCRRQDIVDHLHLRPTSERAASSSQHRTCSPTSNRRGGGEEIPSLGALVHPCASCSSCPWIPSRAVHGHFVPQLLGGEVSSRTL